MKLDKATIMKHHFWVLFGLFVPLVLVIIIMLWTSVAGVVAEQNSKITSTKTKLEGLAKGQVKNARWIELLKKKEGELAAQKEKIWKEVWDKQASVMTWPAALLREFPSVSDSYFGDEFPQAFRDKYATDSKGYESQVPEIVNIVKPVDERGAGVVQFRGGYRSVLRYVFEWARTQATSEEVWLAQEDIWVQRELLQAVRDANDYAANLVKVNGVAKPDATQDEVDRQAYANPTWRLEIIVTNDKLRYQLTNVSPRQQTLGVRFNVKQKGSKQPIPLLIEGEPLSPNQSTKWFEASSKTVLSFKGLDGVEQELDWRTAPVKRIDRIEFGWPSHRTREKEIKPSPALVALRGEDPAAATDPTRTGEGPGPMGIRGGDDRMAPGGMNPNSSRTDSGLERNRYVDVNDQVRRMPIGMVMIVDQDHVQDVLTAFANSRLRFQITQWQIQRYRGSIRPGSELDPSGAPSPMPGPRDSGREGGRSFPPGPGSPLPGVRRGPSDSGEGRPTPPPGMMDPSMTMNVGDEVANLVELAVYGVASLYQKYPPKSAKPAEGTAAPGAPAPSAPTTPTPAAPTSTAPEATTTTTPPATSPTTPPPATPPATSPPAPATAPTTPSPAATGTETPPPATPPKPPEPSKP